MAESDPDPAENSTLAGEAAADITQFANLIAHYYRAEMDRMTTWRTRLDQTTNWAVILMSTILTWSFTSESNPHYVLLVGMFTVIAFLVVEAGRFRKYDAWRAHVRVLQRNLFADAYDPAGADRTEWRERMGRDLRDPELRMSIRKALGHRLRRVYLFLLSALFGAWLFRVTAFDPDQPWHRTAAIADVPGRVVVLVVGGVYLLLVALAVESAIEDVRKREFADET